MLGMLALIALGIAALGLGIKGFTAEGLPLGHESRIRGPAGKAVGVVCILIGLAAFAVAAVILIGRLERTS